MFTENITIHDKYQFELKLGYFANKKKPAKYSLEMYFFIPKSLDINQHTYTKEEFYKDIQIYIRFKTPEYTLKEIQCLIEKLKTYVQKQENYYKIETEIKLVCSIIRSALRKYSTSKNKKKTIKEFVKSIHKITKEYREIENEFYEIYPPYYFGDEYISQVIEHYSYWLLNKNLSRTDKKLLLDLILTENEHRKKQKYRSIASKKNDNEELLFRKSVLKKYIGEVLYLKVKKTRTSQIIKQAIFGIAAGLAMAFATLIAFFSQYQFGNFTLPFFLALVIAYVFKDRMKEVGREYLSSKLRHVMPDNTRNIYRGRKKIGVCEESFDFIKEKKVPKKLRELRNKDHITEIENDNTGEKIIRYTRNIKLFTLKSLNGHVIEGINDIVRVNLTKFLRKMDNPKKTLHVLTEKGYEKIKGEKVYHINLITRYKTPHGQKQKRFKLIVNRKGLKRIERY